MRRHLAPLAVVVATGIAPASANSDVQLWNKAAVKYELSDALELNLNGLFRLEDDVTEVQNTAIEIEPEARIGDNFRLNVGYRMSNRRTNDDQYELRHRFQLDLRPRIEPGPFRLEYRLRLQHSIRPGEDRDAFRNQFEISHRRLDPVEPYLAFEIRHRVGDGEGVRLRSLRYTAGANLELSKAHEVGAFFRVETPEEDPEDPTEIIFGLDYAIRL